jgi:hypothetical protein
MTKDESKEIEDIKTILIGMSQESDEMNKRFKKIVKKVGKHYDDIIGDINALDKRIKELYEKFRSL